jgi:hypothetical protein
LKHAKLSILLTLFIVVFSMFTYAAMHHKNNDNVSLSLFELPEDLPYLYCEFNGRPDTKGSSEKFVLFVFWQNNKMHRITGTAFNEEEWDFRANTPGAQQVINRINQMHVRKAKLLPKPEDRNVEGRILACDAGLLSRLTQDQNTPLYFQAELSKQNDYEYIMDFNLLNIESLISAAWINDLIPISIKDFPFAKTPAYAHFASNITLLELIPQLQNLITENAKDTNVASSLRSMRGTFYAAIGSESALWDGISVPALSLKIELENNAMKQTLFDFIYGLFNKKYELDYSYDGYYYYAYAPSSIWLSEYDNVIETGIIDRRSAAKYGTILPVPPKEALLWSSFSPRHLAEAINNFTIQISPDLDFKEELRKLSQIDNCTLTLNSINSGVIKWRR